ncbi:MAG: sulfotransferase [Bdellovibrionales bacterium]
MISDPVFIVGTERSGSNLLRLLLNELPEIAIPHPPHLMRDLAPVVRRYGALTEERNFRRLVQDAVRLVELHFAPWPVRLEVEELMREIPERDLYSVYAAIYEQYRKFNGKARWGCKSTFMIHHVADILQHHSSPQFVHLVRDVRDVAVSARRSVFCHFHPYYVARLWAEEQRRGIEWSAKVSSNQWLTVRYEDLIRHPARTLRTVCEFLGSTYTEEALKFFERPAARELSKLSRSWENVSKPVMKNNADKFLRHLSEHEIRLIEAVAQQEMEHFGYGLVTPAVALPEAVPKTWERAQYFASECWMKIREEGRALLHDRNARFRLRKKAFLWRLGWN